MQEKIAVRPKKIPAEFHALLMRTATLGMEAGRASA